MHNDSIFLELSMEVDVQDISAQVDRFAALGHPLRLAVLRHLIQAGPAGSPAGEVQAAVGIPASTLSHHLNTLAAARLVAVDRQGTTLRYRPDFDTLRALTAFLWDNCCGRAADPDAGACCAAPVAVPEPSQPPVRSWCPDFD